MKNWIGIAGFFLVMIHARCQTPEMVFEVDGTRNLDTFYVELKPNAKLKSENAVFQFAATAPGTYQTMNIGRFVSNFQAFDKQGNVIPVTNSSVNRYQISKPGKVDRITYSVAETFDTKVDEFPVYRMCGTSIEQDHLLINAHDVLGYFTGYQDSPIRLKVEGKTNWKTGSALEKEGDYFVAESFDHMVDSPILMGNLTYADTTIAGTPIEIFTYSQQGKISSKILLSSMSGMLDAARQFLVQLPVDHYTFLYYFETDLVGGTGAWEHSYSSEYVMKESDPTERYLTQITDVASHEFFHIVTPLNIHSEVIESFNFVSPTPSVHLWMYEGLTEWASNILLLRGGIWSLDEYLETGILQKINISDRRFDSSWSLKRIAEESFTKVGAKQYGNIYMKGALVAGLLDIRLLELSGGTYGLRELMLELVVKYGKGNPVSEANFFDDIAKMTYPEIRAFFDEFVIGNQPLPYDDYLQKLGLELIPNEGKTASINRVENPTESQQKLFDAWSKNLPIKQF